VSKLRALIESGFIDRGDGTILDTRTNFLWQQSSPSKKFTWKESNEYCKSLMFVGYSDWRLPTKEELEYLINRKYSPSIDPIFECKPSWYWSSSTYAYDPIYACLAHFYDGYIHHDYRGCVHFIRAVRG